MTAADGSRASGIPSGARGVPAELLGLGTEDTLVFTGSGGPDKVGTGPLGSSGSNPFASGSKRGPSEQGTRDETGVFGPSLSSPAGSGETEQEEEGDCPALGMLAQLKSVDQAHIMGEIDNNFEFNVVILGDPGVGKTSMVQKVINNY